MPFVRETTHSSNQKHFFLYCAPLCLSVRHGTSSGVASSGGASSGGALFIYTHAEPMQSQGEGRRDGSRDRVADGLILDLILKFFPEETGESG